MEPFSDKYPQEEVYLGFDFSNRLDPVETIQTATFYIRSTAGVDHDSSLMLTGGAVVNGGNVRTKVQNGIAGYRYELSVLIDTSGGRVLFAKREFRVAA